MNTLNAIKLPNFKQYLASKICTSIYNKEWNLNDINLFNNDMSIIPTKIIQAKGGDKIYNWDKIVITDQMVENQEFTIKMQFDTLALPDASLSFKTLKKISESFNTEDISVSGDGNDYQLSEYTGGHDSEVKLSIKPHNAKQLIEEYIVWHQSLEEQNEAKKLEKAKNKMK